ncbi:MAG: hypothetical protein AAGA50_09180 [Pseudomonadota bacterium]
MPQPGSESPIAFLCHDYPTFAMGPGPGVAANIQRVRAIRSAVFGAVSSKRSALAQSEIVTQSN